MSTVVRALKLRSLMCERLELNFDPRMVEEGGEEEEEEEEEGITYKVLNGVEWTSDAASCAVSLRRFLEAMKVISCGRFPPPNRGMETNLLSPRLMVCSDNNDGGRFSRPLDRWLFDRSRCTSCVKFINYKQEKRQKRGSVGNPAEENQRGHTPGPIAVYEVLDMVK